MLKALIFDLDDTLLDSTRVRNGIEQAIRTVASIHGLDEAAFMALNIEVWTKRWTEMATDFETGKATGETVSLSVWEETLNRAGIDGTTHARAAYEETRKNEMAAYQLFPDALDVLAHFRDRGLKLGLITNGAPDTQQPKIDLLNLAPHFDHMVISGALGIAKPDAAIFGHMLNRLGVNPADAAYVGDSPENDVVGAQQAGLTAIWRDHGNRPPSHHNPDYTIRQLSDIKELPILI